jgi:hypothetical protein
MKINRACLSALAMLAFQAAFAAEPTHVVIDPSDRHTTTFVGVPAAVPAEEFRKLKDSLVQRKGAYMLTWSEFKSDPPKHVRQYIRRNDYPDVDVVSGLARLLERYDGTPFGLTWNGGLAVTESDYRHAARTYAVYSSDPGSFRTPERRGDPVHPANHLEPLLGR